MEALREEYRLPVIHEKDSMSLGVIESAALEAMARGWAVFPVKGKKPVTSNGLKDASTEARLAAIWFERHPTRGLAVATGDPSGVWVLDLDGPEAVQRFVELQEEHGAVEKGVASKTARGYHLYFKMPVGGDIRNSAGKVAPGIDVRGTGGYVVLPPSPHPDGEGYRWRTGRGPDDTTLTDATTWLLKMVRAETNGRHEPAGPIPDRIIEGRRNDTLTSIAGSLRHRGASREAMLAAIRVENETRCVPPLPDDEVEKIAGSVAGYRPAPSAVASTNGGSRATPPETEEETKLPLAVSALDAEAPETPTFSISGFLLDREIHLLVSDGGEGKTTLALAIAGSMAGGYNLFDMREFKVAKPGPVLFVSEEDGIGVLQNRLEALIRGHGWDRERVLSSVYLIAQEGTSLDASAWCAHILAEVERIGARLLVLDPLAELTSAAENSNDDTKPLVRFFREITAKTLAGVLVLHHAGKKVEGKRKLDRIRGASALNAAARAIYFLESMEIGIAIECLKMSRAEKPRRFVVKRVIESAPENRAMWMSARLTYQSQMDAEDETAEKFILDQLTRRGTLNSSELKALAKGASMNAVAISGALKNLSALGQIDFTKGSRGAKNWFVTDLAEKSEQGQQGTLPRLLNLAQQGEESSLEVASSIGEATRASDAEQPGKVDDDSAANDGASQSSFADSLTVETATDVGHAEDDVWTA